MITKRFSIYARGDIDTGCSGQAAFCEVEQPCHASAREEIEWENFVGMQLKAAFQAIWDVNQRYIEFEVRVVE